MVEAENTQAESTHGAAACSGLTDFEAAVLEFEAQWPVYSGAKDRAIRESFDLGAADYFQALGALLDDPRAYIADPILIKRLRRIRDTRQHGRAAHRIAK
ncbi:DUF3263 domain-containing protein [Brevibacterium sp. 91QC2O2]|uniref:DUF3263 domain-containing protein n=1 Tax=Brevibacterium sp. 91QC2O2 TaxID=2968458 RepID=UPI00211BDAC5|nr:DUF3263 domain-containing protein [Brevibacterium sp. 91QC2O2]MCQ9369075.1 DUF3263 domain-containing protein [Brevibacterium sp. 91QC2O2]